MKHKILAFGFILFCSISFSQNIDSLKILHNNVWRTKNWVERDTVVLFSIPNIERTYNALTPREKSRQRKKYRRFIYGEHISFKSGKLHYRYAVPCITGASHGRAILDIRLLKNKVVIDYKDLDRTTKQWNSKTKTFDILKWSNDYIVLKY
ncbi:hypothetical protein [uncultured Psychroserpens sp.]|uniref:hypothetical protein n=1 Tax=uncultured Psychroserpens sp. TaxID=255436 RepID=UPI002635236B|nr:hypothetical protein [uncultured Psychroserpens sp.]